jgi:16S rRNA processing protein RimM
MAEDSPQPTDDGRICVGIVTGVHGLKGLVRIKPFTETPEAVTAYGSVETEDGSRRLELEFANKTGKGQIAVRVAGIADRDAAEALKGQRLYVRRERLPATEADEFYHADLIGLAVQRSSGPGVGKVRGVYDFGAGDVLEIVDEMGSLIMMPFTRDAVPEIDLAAGVVIVADSYVDEPGDTDEPADIDEPEGA